MKKSDMEKACIGAFGKEMFDSKAKRNPQRSFAEGFLSQRCQDAATHLDSCKAERIMRTYVRLAGVFMGQ